MESNTNLMFRTIVGQEMKINILTFATLFMQEGCERGLDMKNSEKNVSKYHHLMPPPVLYPIKQNTSGLQLKPKHRLPFIDLAEDKA